MEINIFKAFWEYWLVWWSFLLFILLVLYLLKKMIDTIPKAIDKHFMMIDKMTNTFSNNLDKVVSTFEKKINESNKWHLEHSNTLNTVNNNVVKIKKHLNIND